MRIGNQVNVRAQRLRLPRMQLVLRPRGCGALPGLGGLPRPQGVRRLQCHLRHAMRAKAHVCVCERKCASDHVCARVRARAIMCCMSFKCEGACVRACLNATCEGASWTVVDTGASNRYALQQHDLLGRLRETIRRATEANPVRSHATRLCSDPSIASNTNWSTPRY